MYSKVNSTINEDEFYFSDNSQLKKDEYEKDFYEKINKILFLDKSPKIEKEQSLTNDISKIKNQSIQSIQSSNFNFESLLDEIKREINLFQKGEKDNKNKIKVIESINNNKKNEKNKGNRGRKEKGYKIEDETKELHTKFSKDNLLRKIKIHPIKFGIDLINDCIKNEFKKQSYIIRNISTQVTSDITINFNNQFFGFSLKKILILFPINNKYKKISPDKNIKVIKKLMSKKHINPITNELLDMKFSEIYNLFIEGNKEYLKKFGIKRAKTFDDFLYNLNEENEYINDLKTIGYNFMDYFDPKNARRIKKTIQIIPKIII